MDGVNERANSDPYAVLGVGRNATQQQIAKSDRRLAKRHHPDVQLAACGRTDATPQPGGRSSPARSSAPGTTPITPRVARWSALVGGPPTGTAFRPRGAARGRLRHLQPAPTYHRRMSRPIPPMSGYGRGSLDDRDRPRCIVALFVGLLPFPLFDLRYSSLRGQSSGASRIATDASGYRAEMPGQGT